MGHDTIPLPLLPTLVHVRITATFDDVVLLFLMQLS